MQKVVVKLDCRVGHFEPPDVDAHEEIIGKRRNFATVDDEVIDLVAAETFDGLAQNLRILNVPTIGDDFHLLLLGRLAQVSIV